MAQTKIDDYVRLLLVESNSRRPKPLLRALLPEATEATAYQVLNLYVEQRSVSNKISGFKGALTNAGAQKMFGTSSSAMGVLFDSSQLSPNAIISTSDYLSPLIETEIGFRVNKDIPYSADPLSTSDLLAHIGHALPMIEIVDVGVDGKLAGAIDLIAINNAAANYIPGETLTSINEQSAEALANISVTLSRNQEPLGNGSANDAMDGQITAVTWLANQVMKQGYTIDAGTYLMTGSLGRPYPAIPGKYCADYGSFGSINFEFT
jgi:2-keto-4-pentenoate hydratase